MPLTFTDQLGRTVELPHTPKRIVSLVPSQTELLFYLGLDEEVVGITKFCIHPEKQFRTKTRVGGTKQLKLDKIRSLKPGLIIGNKEENTREQIEELARDLPAWLSDIQKLDDAEAMILAIGRLVGRQPQAEALAKRIRGRFSKLEEDFSGLTPIRAAYFIWRKPYMVVAGNTFIDDMLHRAGFENVFADKDRYPKVSLEETAAARPEVLLLSSEPYPFKEKHLEEFRAACPGVPIQLVNGELFSWYGSRLLYAADYFRQLQRSLSSSISER